MTKVEREQLVETLGLKGFDFCDGGPIYSIILVGSRVTCDPPPTDTDQDVLVHTDPAKINEVINYLCVNGWELDGSEPDAWDNVGVATRFQSFSKGEYNLIVTSSGEFFNKFSTATAVAKHLNLLKKEDRIILFQAVLYGLNTTRQAEYIRQAMVA